MYITYHYIVMFEISTPYTYELHPIRFHEHPDEGYIF